MNTANRIIRTGMTIFFAIVMGSYSGSAQTSECTAITKMPAVISNPGTYCLNAAGKAKSISVKLQSGNAISITADNVVLDLSGIELINTAKNNEATAVRAQQSMIIVKNGSITGFSNGVRVGDFASFGNAIENMSISSTAFGIDIRGKGSLVRNNTVNGVGTGARYGILIDGPESRLINNKVNNFRRVSIDITSRSAPADTSSIVDNNKVDTNDRLSGVGIRIRSARASVVNNTVANMETGFQFMKRSSVDYQNNVADRCTTPYQIEEETIVVDSGSNK